jgi:DNA-binding response OmpR family regulator
MGKIIYSAAELSLSACNPWPGAQQAAPIAKQDEQSSPAALENTHHTEAPTILIVSNDDSLRSMIRAYLEHLGFAVISCSDARRAPEIAHRCARVHLLLLDLGSLDGEGGQVAAELADWRAGMAALILSDRGLTTGEAALAAKHAWELMKKPLRLPDLLAAIRHALDRSERRRASQAMTHFRSGRNVIPMPEASIHRYAARPSPLAPTQPVLARRRAEGDVRRP